MNIYKTINGNNICGTASGDFNMEMETILNSSSSNYQAGETRQRFASQAAAKRVAYAHARTCTKQSTLLIYLSGGNWIVTVCVHQT